MAAHVGLAAMSGLAMAATPADDAPDDWPFGDLVICTSDGVQLAGPDEAGTPAQANLGAHCDSCITTCCAGMGCDRAGGMLVLRQPLGTVPADWLTGGRDTAEPAPAATLGNRGPPLSA